MKLFPRNVLLVFCNQSRLLSSSRGPAISPDPGGDGENHLQGVFWLWSAVTMNASNRLASYDPRPGGRNALRHCR